jgi:hypothetical protein
MTTKRWTLVAGTAGLVGGLALGATGLASAGSPTSPPAPSQGKHQAGDRFRGGPEHGLGRAGGLVTAVTGDSVTLRTGQGTKTVALTSSTTYANGEATATKSILKVGSLVFVKLVDPAATKPVAAAVTVLPAHLSGFITRVDGSTVTITDESGFTRTITTAPTTTYEKDGAAATSSILSVGALIRGLGTVDADGTTLDATKVSVGRPAHLDRPKHLRGPGGPGGFGADRGPRPSGAPTPGVPG